MAPGAEDKRNHAGRRFGITFCGWRVFPIRTRKATRWNEAAEPRTPQRGAKWLGIV